MVEGGVTWRLFLIILCCAALILLVEGTLSWLSIKGVFRAILSIASALALSSAAAYLISGKHKEQIAGLCDVIKPLAGGSTANINSLPHSKGLAIEYPELLNALSSIKEYVAILIAQSSEMHSVISSIREAVICVDNTLHVVNLNKAAEDLFAIPLTKARGKTIQEIIRSFDLQRILQDTLNSKTCHEMEFSHRDSTEHIVHVHTSFVRDGAGKCIGALAMLNDITEVRRLERVRQEFVANVSHELKTPITSIKGFLETLLAGALAEPETAHKFVSIAHNQSERLNSIIEDLLTLSKIEQEEYSNRPAQHSHPVHTVINAAIMTCLPRANEKSILVEYMRAPDIHARMNPVLIEQALVNLIDNAVKYSDNGTRIRVKTFETDQETVISVQDEGPGIDAKHVPQIFERFFRIDPARSRKIGGTGLGLAIVKHIALSHGGRATVETSVGAGSTFSIHLPRL